MTTVGARVWCVRNATDTTVYAYGFGTYLGEHRLPGHPDAALLAICETAIRRHDAGPPLIDPSVYFGQQVADGKLTRAEADWRIAQAEAADAADKARPVQQRARELADRLYRNPKISLDGGGVVWGCQCWWGEADDNTPQQWARGRTIIAVPAPEPPGAVAR